MRFKKRALAFFIGLLIMQTSIFAQYERKITIAIFPFQFYGNAYDNNITWISDGFQDILRARFNRHYKHEIRILNRQRLEEQIKELQLSQSGFVDPEQSLKIGKYFSANFSINGNITCPTANDVMVTANILNIETSEQVTVEALGTFSDLYKTLGDSLVHKIYPVLVRLNRQRQEREIIEQVETAPPSVEPDQGFRILSVTSNTANAYFYNANDMMRKQDWKNAEIELKRAIKLDPDFARAYVNLGVVYTNLGQFQMAKECLNKALIIYPQSDLAYQNLGFLAVHTNDIRSSLYYFQSALDISPDNCEIMVEIGKVYYKLNDFNSARKVLNEVLSIDSSYVEANFYIGVVEAKSGSYDLAEQHWLRVIQSEESYFLPARQKALEKLGYLWSNFKNDPAKAVECYEKALHLSSGRISENELKAIYLPLSLLYIKTDNFNKAQSLLETVLDFEPSNIEARYYYAVALKNSAREDLAITQFEIITKMNPAGKYYENAKKNLVLLRGY